jgi:hypothetical protein
MPLKRNAHMPETETCEKSNPFAIEKRVRESDETNKTKKSRKRKRTEKLKMEKKAAFVLNSCRSVEGRVYSVPQQSRKHYSSEETKRPREGSNAKHD